MSGAGGACRRPSPTEASWQPDGGWVETSVPLKCLYFKELQTFLPPSLPGFQKVRDEGSTGKYGRALVSEAERVFAREQQEISVRIVDSSAVSGLAAGVAAASEAARQQASPSAAALSGPSAVGYVRYDAAEERAEANLLVADRFVFSVSGRGFKDTSEVKRIAEGLDSEKLAKLR